MHKVVIIQFVQAFHQGNTNIKNYLYFKDIKIYFLLECTHKRINNRTHLSDNYILRITIKLRMTLAIEILQHIKKNLDFTIQNHYSEMISQLQYMFLSDQ